VLMTGSSIDATPTNESLSQGFTGVGSFSLNNAFPVILFYIALLAIFATVYANTRSLFTVLRWIVGISLIWLAYSVLLAIFYSPIISPMTTVINQVMGRSLNPLTFYAPLSSFLIAPFRVFATGMIYWVLSYMTRRVPVTEERGRRVITTPRPAGI
jgi:hypothetical protein